MSRRGRRREAMIKHFARAEELARPLVHMVWNSKGVQWLLADRGVSGFDAQRIGGVVMRHAIEAISEIIEIREGGELEIEQLPKQRSRKEGVA